MDDKLSKRELNRLKRKEQKAKGILMAHENINLSKEPTEILYISNGGLGNGVSREHIYQWLSPHVDLAEIIMLERKPYCFVKTLDIEGAIKLSAMSGTKVMHDGIEQPIEHHISFVESLPKTRVKSQSMPSGLVLLEDYISEEYECDLIELLDWSKEESLTQSVAAAGSSMKHRSVKHFGYEFMYSNNNVDPDKPLEEKIPDKCNDVVEKLLQDGLITDKPDQLTVNKYLPGQGIPPHVDTHSAFLEPIVSLSLGSQVIMNFSHPDGDTCQVVLPRRSVLVMSGASRYLWTHGIIPRKTDVMSTADGLTLNYRSTRISYTFRRLRRAPCNCNFLRQCDSQKEAKKQTDSASSLEKLSEEAAVKLEQIHVHQVYDQIADHFSGTRHTQWPQVAAFISRQPEYSILADIGCGNGKYLTTTSNNVYKIGFERSSGLLDVCHSRGYPVVQADCLFTPLVDNSVDTCLCIAVIHHLSTWNRRLAAIQELVRILRRGGECLIYVWAMEQKKDSVKSNYLKQNAGEGKAQVEHLEMLDGTCQLPVHKNRTQFYSSDMLVPWNLKTKVKAKSNDKTAETDQNDSENKQTVTNSNLYHRYYHIFKEGELEKLCRNVDGCEIIQSYYDQGNWCVILRKL